MFVITLDFLAARRRVRACQRSWVSGCCVTTCLPRCIDSSVAAKWVWSGVLMQTASISLPILSSMTLKSENFFTPARAG